MIDVNLHYFQVLFQSNDISREMQQDEHNKLVLVLIQNVYIVHMYDIIDMLMLEVHQQKNDYHPIKHDNVMVEMYLVYQHQLIMLILLHFVHGII